ncbi:hypothetical protein BCR34DRAFT_487985 [Clohesyomyces aquaticus]|uniref:C2H2-type domain-containing protein n=1 Tax=Clohesyomyces aquaticus TaxID=1231657 RepID=A0A1Y1ZFR4_9PLEO|nr:hypothetical protein BCR34DRAFT_487985 [Clohesyomyces aquaticus]
MAARPGTAECRGGRIHDLPEELLDAILRNIRDTAPASDFWNCLKACRQWHRIGLAVHGHLDLSTSAIIESETRRHDLKAEVDNTLIPLKTEFMIHTPSSWFLSGLRCLTVHVLHSRIASPFEPVGKGFFEQLCDTFKTTKRLSTFSLRFADDGWDFPVTDVPAILGTQLARLVSELPSTVVNLEIDTVGVDIPPSRELLEVNPTGHLCYQISQIFPRLQHLRLRVAHVCEILLDSGPLFEPCLCTRAYCGVSLGKASCPLAASWKMRRLTVWIPEGQDDSNNSFVRASKRLTEHCASHAPLAVLVHQRRTLTCTLDPGFICGNFTWSVESNFHNLRASGYTEHNQLSRWDAKRFSCRDHEILTRSPRRYFLLSDERTPRTPFPYMTEWVLESSSMWAQKGHQGCRYPIAKGNEPGHPYWEASYPEKGLWACLFPRCRTRCRSLHALQGHQMYMHPEKPYDECHHGFYPCPSVGCSRIGVAGFPGKEEVEEHVRRHHRNACTMQQDSD